MATHIQIRSGELESRLMVAARCADCGDPACVRVCPEHVDLQGLLRFFVSQANLPVTWMQDVDAAEFGAEGIEASYH